MNRKKFPKPSPMKKCLTKNVMLIGKKKVYGTFKAEISIENISDETSSMENTNPWITDSERSETSDVFESQNTSLSSGDEDVLSPTETLRESERQYDEWSLSHLHEDPIESLVKDSVDDILTTPEKRTYSASVEPTNRIFFSERIDLPEISPVVSNFEEIEKLSETLHEPEIEKKSKFSKHGSERHHKKILNSTRVDGQFVMPRFEEIEDISSISCNIRGNTEGQCQHGEKSISSKTGMTSKEFIGDIVLQGVHNQTFTKLNTFNQDVPKSNSLMYPRLPKDSFLHSVTLIPSRKCLKDLHRDFDNICETPKAEKGKNIPKRKILLNENLPHKTNQENILTKSARENAIESDKNNENKVSKVISDDDLFSTVTIIPLISPLMDESGNIIGTQSLKSSKENEVKSPTGTLINDSDQPKKTPAAKLKKNTSKKEPKKYQPLTEQLCPTSLLPVPVTEDMVVSAESTKRNKTFFSTLCRKKSTPFKGLVSNDGKHSKKSTMTQLLKKKKDLQKRKSSKEKCLSADLPSISIKDFIVPTESEDNTGVRYLNLPESNSKRAVDDEDSWKVLVPERHKRKNHPRKKSSYDSSIEDFIATDSSTVMEDSIDYMDDTEPGDSKSEGSTEKFLEENNLYESECSTEKESSKLGKRKIKKNIQKNSKEEKSLSEKLREYKEYLKTIPYDDLSLKKWHKKERNKKK